MGNLTVRRVLASLLGDGDADADADDMPHGADTRPAHDEHEHIHAAESSGERASRQLAERTPLWARVLLAICQQQLDVLEREYSMPSDDPIAAHFGTVGTTEQILATYAAGSVLRALYVGGTGGTGGVSVLLHHTSFPGGIKTIAAGVIGSNPGEMTRPAMRVRVPRGATLGVQQAAGGTVTDLYVTAIVTRDRETGVNWLKGLH